MSLSCFLDFGNSRVKAWLCDGGLILGRVSHAYRLDTGSLFRVMPAEFRRQIGFVGVSSVLSPHVNADFTLEAEKTWGVTPLFAESQAVSCGIQNAYLEPSSLGVDRWMNILGVSSGQGSVFCVVSCGTALTLDLLANNRHLGGYILPGQFLQMQSLIRGTQKVRPEAISDGGLMPGLSTTHAVHHGILLGQVAMVERCFQALLREFPDEARLVLTGGDADKLSPHLSCPHDIIPELVLMGLQRYFGQAVSQ